ncbi:MAG: hypothetical protein WBB84_01325, partial [Candidatus Omnitrophota bacterium]
FCAFAAVFSAAGTCEWKEKFVVSSGNISSMECLNGTGLVYLGTSEGLYRSDDSGENWNKDDIPGEVSEIRDIAVSEGKVAVATDNGIYIGRGKGKGKGGEFWERIIGKKDIAGVAICRLPGQKDILLAWADEVLYKINDDDLVRAGSGSLWRKRIDDVVCHNGAIYTAAGGSILRSPDGGDTWERMKLVSEYGPAEDLDEKNDFENTENDEVKESKLSLIGNIDPSGKGITVSTERGIFQFRVKDGAWDRIDTTGLPSTRVKYVAGTGGVIFAATDRNVFLYSAEGREWRSVFELPVQGSISFVKSSIDGDERIWLWTANRKRLFRHDALALIKAADDLEKGKDIPDALKEPSILEVQRMAINYAEVSPDKIKRWRSGAKWKALLPRLSFGISESKDDQVEIYTSSTKNYHYVVPDVVDTGWDIDLTWDLSDLVWNDSQTSIDVRSKLMVQLRDEILEEVTRLYFERKRILVELEESTPRDKRKLREKRMRIEELTAHIDALTGGQYSKALNDRR